MVTGPLLPDLIFVFSSLFFIYYFKKDFKEIIKTYFVFFIFWLILILCSLLSENILISLKSSLFYIRFFLFSLLICYLLKKKLLDINLFLRVLTFLYLFLIIDSHFQYFVGNNILGIDIESKMRISSVFGSELIMGSFILKTFPLYLVCLFILKKDRLFYLLPLIYSSLILSGERTTILLSIIFLLFFLILKIDLKKKLLIFFLVLLVFVLHFNFNKNFNYNFTERVKEEVILNFNLENDKEYSYKKVIPFNLFTENHTRIYNTAYLMFLDKKIYGHGPNMYRYKCSIYDNNSCTTHPHNHIFQILAEAGILGIFMYFIIFIIICKNLYISVLPDSKNSNIKILLSLSLILNFFPFSPSGNFFNNYLNIMMYFPLGFYLYYFNIKNSNEFR